MIKENTKFIIATNFPEGSERIEYLDKEIIEPINQVTNSETEILFMPTAALMAYSTYKSAGEGKIPIVVPVGGDGTINWHLNNADIYPHSTIYLPLASGTANDIATTIHINPTNVRKILEKGRLRQARPLRIQNGPVQKKALGYIGLGITGQCAKEINSRKNVKPSLLKDSAVSIKGILKSRRLKVNNSSQPVLSSNHLEIAAVNSRMASFLWPKNPSVFEDHFYLLSPEGYIGTAGLAIKGLKKRLKGKKINLGESVEFEVENIGTKRRPIYGQCDGEEFLLEDSKINISKNSSPINIFSLT